MMGCSGLRPVWPELTNHHLKPPDDVRGGGAYLSSSSLVGKGEETEEEEDSCQRLKPAHTFSQDETRSGMDDGGGRWRTGRWTHLPLLLSVAVTERLPLAGTATPRVPRGSSRSLKRQAAIRDLWVL